VVGTEEPPDEDGESSTPRVYRPRAVHRSAPEALPADQE